MEEIRIKLVKEPRLEYNSITSPQKAVEMIQDLIGDLDRENFVLVNLDNAGKPINYNIVSIGTESQSLVSIANVMRGVILSGSTNIMVFHNHPSGNTNPSQADIDVTNKLQSACNLMDVKLIDHIIVSDVEYYSFKNNNLLNNYSLKQANEVLFEKGNNDVASNNVRNSIRNKSNDIVSLNDKKNDLKNYSRNHQEFLDYCKGKTLNLPKAKDNKGNEYLSLIECSIDNKRSNVVYVKGKENCLNWIDDEGLFHTEPTNNPNIFAVYMKFSKIDKNFLNIMNDYWNELELDEIMDIDKKVNKQFDRLSSVEK